VTERRALGPLSNGLDSASIVATAKAHALQTHPTPYQPGAIA
jgi:hypothetical protein